MAGLPGHKHWLDTICSKKSTWTSGIACNIEESRPNASILESDGDACNADRGIYQPIIIQFYAASALIIFRFQFT